MFDFYTVTYYLRTLGLLRQILRYLDYEEVLSVCLLEVIKNITNTHKDNTHHCFVILQFYIALFLVVLHIQRIIYSVGINETSFQVAIIITLGQRQKPHQELFCICSEHCHQNLYRMTFTLHNYFTVQKSWSLLVNFNYVFK